MVASYVGITTDVSTMSVSFAHGTSTTATLAIPTGVQDGDLLMAFCAADCYTSTVLSLAVSGFSTEVHTQGASIPSASNNGQVSACLLFWANGNPTSYTLTASAVGGTGGCDTAICGIIAYRGVNNFLAGAAAANTASGTAVTTVAPAHAADTNNFGAISLPLVTFWVLDGYTTGSSNYAFADPTSNTNRGHLSRARGGASASIFKLEIEEEIWASAASFPARTGTWTWTTNRTVGAGGIRINPTAPGTDVPHSSCSAGGDAWAWLG